MSERRLWVEVYSQPGREFEDFERCANFVGNLFTYKMPPVAIKGIKKLAIDFNHGYDAPNIHVFEGVLNITIGTFPFNLFEIYDLNRKIALITDETYQGLVLAYQHLNLGIAKLDIGYKKILDDDYRLSYVLFNGAKLNRGKTIESIVIAKFCLDYTIVKVKFRYKTNDFVNEVELFKTIPGGLFFNLLIKTCKWIDNETFELSNNTKEINFRINIDGHINLHYLPVNRDIDGIKEEIKYYTLKRSFVL